MTEEKGQAPDPKVEWTMEDYKRAIKEAADMWHVSVFDPDHTKGDEPLEGK